MTLFAVSACLLLEFALLAVALCSLFGSRPGVSRLGVNFLAGWFSFDCLRSGLKFYLDNEERGC